MADVKRSTIDIICVKVETARSKSTGVRKKIPVKTMQLVTVKALGSIANVQMATQAIFASSRTGFARWETTNAKMEEPAGIVVHIRLAIANQDLKVCKIILKSNGGGGGLKDRS